MAKLIVDSRESRSGLAQLLARRGAEIVVEELESGDYVLAEGVAVERKTAVDFVQSLIVDKRIFSQVATLKRTYAKAYILVEGDLFATQSNIADDALVGAMSYLNVIENVPVIHTRDVTQTASMLITMQRHALEGLGYEVALRGAKPKDRTPQAQYLVEGLPGIGPTVAKKLLAHFGSAYAVFTASPEQLKAVPGVGPKMIATLREVLEFDTLRGARPGDPVMVERPPGG